MPRPARLRRTRRRQCPLPLRRLLCRPPLRPPRRPGPLRPRRVPSLLRPRRIPSPSLPQSRRRARRGRPGFLSRRLQPIRQSPHSRTPSPGNPSPRTSRLPLRTPRRRWFPANPSHSNRPTTRLSTTHPRRLCRLRSSPTLRRPSRGPRGRLHRLTIRGTSRPRRGSPLPSSGPGHSSLRCPSSHLGRAPLRSPPRLRHLLQNRPRQSRLPLLPLLPTRARVRVSRPRTSAVPGPPSVTPCVSGPGPSRSCSPVRPWPRSTAG